MSRGLTLLEVVADTVLLTMIVAAGIPLFRFARADLQAASPPAVGVAQSGLEHAIDDLLVRRPDLLAECIAQPTGYSVAWTSGGRAFNTHVRLHPVVYGTEHERRTTHTWAVFTLDGAEFLRWVRVPTPLRGGGDSP